MPRAVMIVDPEPFFCEALAAALDVGEEVRTVGWTSDGRRVSELVDSLSPEIVLWGLDHDAALVSWLIKRLEGRALVVVLTRRRVGDALLEAAAAGAAGVLSHDLGLIELGELVSDAIDGRFIVDLRTLGEDLKEVAEGPSLTQSGQSTMRRLTGREREVVDLLARGLDNAAIATQLHLSEHTVRTHIGNILRKLEVHTRAEAARLALAATDPGSSVGFRLRGPDLQIR